MIFLSEETLFSKALGFQYGLAGSKVVYPMTSGLGMRLKATLEKVGWRWGRLIAAMWLVLIRTT